MSVSLIQSVVSLPASPFPPLAIGFMGLGTGYLIYGPQELFGYPKRDERVDFATGMWGIWMPGFMQFISGVYLFLGLTLFGTFTAPRCTGGAGVHRVRGALVRDRLEQAAPADPRVIVGSGFWRHTAAQPLNRRRISRTLLSEPDGRVDCIAVSRSG
jgi:hypothetical protein